MPCEKNKIALITGGAIRLGSELCRTFCKAGWHVICHYKSSKDKAENLRNELREQGIQISLEQSDLSDQHQRRSLIDRIIREYGIPTAIVNNASLFEPDSAYEWDLDSTRRQLEVNLLAPIDLTNKIFQHLVNQKNLTSKPCAIHILDQKVYNLNPDYFSYTITKLALERAVYLQAQAVAPYMRICGIAPGLLYESGPQSTENLNVANKVNLLRQPIDPRDVARTALFMAENQSITGTILTVDCGQHLIPLERDVMFVVDRLLQSTRTS